MNEYKLFDELKNDFKDKILDTILYESEDKSLWKDFDFICDWPENHFGTERYALEMNVQLLYTLIDNRSKKDFLAEFKGRDLQEIASFALSDFCLDMINKIDQDYLIEKIHMNYYYTHKLKAEIEKLEKDLKKTNEEDEDYEELKEDLEAKQEELKELQEEWSELYTKLSDNYDAVSWDDIE